LKADELIREVDEELQREKLAQLWRRFGPCIIGAAVLVVVLTGAWVGWQQWQAHRLAAEAIAYADAERLALAQDRSAATVFAEVARDADPGLAALARLGQARALVAAGDRTGAVAALDGLAGDTRADPLLRDLAALQAAALMIDTAAPADLEARLQPLAAVGAPWRHRARELLALARLRAGREAEALTLLKDLADDADAPPALRGRAAELRDALAGPAKGG